MISFLFLNTASSTSHNATFLTPAVVISRYGISRQTLRRWATTGRVECVRMAGGKHLYRAAALDHIFGAGRDNQQQQQKKDILYARVSSEHQRVDLERQISPISELNTQQQNSSQTLAPASTGNTVASKPFWNELSMEKSPERVVVTHKDRLARFAMELIEWIFRRANVQLVVLGQAADHPSVERELADDLLSIVTVFIAKHHGQRSAENRRRRRRATTDREETGSEEGQDEEEDGQTAGGQGQEEPAVSEQEGGGNAHALDRNRSVDVQRMSASCAKRKRTSQQEGAASTSTQ